MDRNNPGWRKDWQQYVALRKESVDRNVCSVLPSRAWTVALRKESVDRNSPPLRLLTPAMSLSARRAWIEISDM